MGVVVDPEVLGQHLGLEERLEDLPVEELVSELAVERLDEGVLPGTAGFDVARARVREPAPVSERISLQLGAVVRAQELRSPACPGDDLV
jgi:hypothetical protein